MNCKSPEVIPREVRPLPQGLWRAFCAKCDKPHSKWEYIKTGNVRIMGTSEMLSAHYAVKRVSS